MVSTGTEIFNDAKQACEDDGAQLTNNINVDDGKKVIEFVRAKVGIPDNRDVFMWLGIKRQSGTICQLFNSITTTNTYVVVRDTTIRRMLIERHFWLHCWLSDFIK